MKQYNSDMYYCTSSTEAKTGWWKITVTYFVGGMCAKYMLYDIISQK